MQQQHIQLQQVENLFSKIEKDKTFFGFWVLVRNVLILIFLIFIFFQNWNQELAPVFQ